MKAKKKSEEESREKNEGAGVNPPMTPTPRRGPFGRDSRPANRSVICPVPYGLARG
jgi:hypothetical protein